MILLFIFLLINDTIVYDKHATYNSNNIDTNALFLDVISFIKNKKKMIYFLLIL